MKAFIDRHLEAQTWLAGDTFTMADRAAAQQVHLSAYFERLIEHPAVVRTIDQVRPHLKFYPGRDGLSRHFFNPANG